MPVIDPYYPVESHERLVAITVIRSDDNDVETLLSSSLSTIADLRKKCISRWNFCMNFVFSNRVQYDSTCLYYFGPRFMRPVPLFGVDIVELPARANPRQPKSMNDHLIPLRVVNVDTSQSVTFLIPPFATAFLLDSWAAREWQFTFDFAYKTNPLVAESVYPSFTTPNLRAVLLSWLSRRTNCNLVIPTIGILMIRAVKPHRGRHAGYLYRNLIRRFHLVLSPTRAVVE